jgi:hypothetical protein
MEDRKMEMFLAALLSVVAADAPVVSNPGFEHLRQQPPVSNSWQGMPADWHLTFLPQLAHLVRYETKAGPGQESKALYITIEEDHLEKNIAYNAMQDVKGFVVGKTYSLSASVRTQGLHTAPFVCVQCLDASKKNFLAFASTPQRALTTDIQDPERFETRITVPPETAVFRLRIGISDDGNEGGTAIIDDVQIVEIQELATAPPDVKPQ